MSGGYGLCAEQIEMLTYPEAFSLLVYFHCQYEQAQFKMCENTLLSHVNNFSVFTRLGTLLAVVDSLVVLRFRK